MRVLFDLQPLQTESRYRGIGRYSYALVRALGQVARDLDPVFVISDAFPDTLAAIGKQLAADFGRQPVVFRTDGPLQAREPANAANRALNEIAYRNFVADLAPDVVLVLGPFEGYVDDALTLLRPEGYQVGAVIYDLIPLILKDQYLTVNPRYAAFYHRILENVRTFSFALSISEHSRQEIVEHLGLDPAQVTNIDGAASETFVYDRNTDRIDPLRSRSFILYTGGGDPRKNLRRLVEAYARLPGAVKDAYRLVLAGNIPAGDKAALVGHAEALGIAEGAIVYLGYVSDEQLRQLYSHCAVLVFPSYYEGLGLPVLEAMRCGAPVLVADATSLPELVQNPEGLFDPYDTESMAGKIAAALTDEAFRQRLIANSLVRAPDHSWERTATLALGALEGLAIPSRPSFPAHAEARRRRYGELVARLSAALAARPDRDDAARRWARAIAANQRAVEAATRRLWPLPERIAWRIEGPFDSSYSLALLNRETARAVAALGHDVALHSTEGPGDFDPADGFLRANPDLAAMHARSKVLPAVASDVESRNLYPPRVEDMAGRLRLLHHYAWEESGFPRAWAETFNDYLDGITCLSTHVRKVLIDSGVAVPLTVTGAGVDHWERVTADPDYRLSARGYRFLHVSSCFPRKGVDRLLEAYGRAFTAKDDVSLVIKTFRNPHNEVHAWLAQQQAGRRDYPHVVIIEADLSDGALRALYEACHAFVAPSFAEGFGLPFAEAILSGLPVVTTGWGGQTDFCTPDTAWLVDYAFEPAETHFGVPDSVWAVPAVEDIARAMRAVREAPPALRQAKVEAGRALLRERFQWRHVGERLVASARAVSRRREDREPRVGWVSTWDTRCGVAAYSQYLLASWRGDVRVYGRRDGQEERVYPVPVAFTWRGEGREDLGQTLAAIERDEIDVVVIQVNYGFFNFGALSKFIQGNHAAGRQVVAVLHATIDPPRPPERRLANLAPALALCARVLVHSHHDLNRLKAIGIVDNAALLPHGVVDYPGTPRPAPRDGVLRVATYGFFLPHKGLVETIEAFALLKARGYRAELRMYNAEYPTFDSSSAIGEARRRIAHHGLDATVALTTDFLSEDEGLDRLAEADLIVFPYQPTAESSSAAVRHGLAVGRPAAVSPLAIFDDVGAAVHRLPGNDAIAIADGIAALGDAIRNGDPIVAETAARASRWRQDHLYGAVSRRMEDMVRSLWVNARFDAGG